MFTTLDIWFLFFIFNTDLDLFSCIVNQQSEHYTQYKDKDSKEDGENSQHNQHPTKAPETDKVLSETNDWQKSFMNIILSKCHRKPYRYWG